MKRTHTLAAAFAATLVAAAALAPGTASASNVAWSVNFSDGDLIGSNKFNVSHARAVRGGR